MTEDNLISIGDLAELSGLAVSRLRRLADSGKIPSVKLPSGHRRFEPNQTLEAIQKRLNPRTLSESKNANFEIRAADWSKKLPLAGLQEDLIWKEAAKRLDLTNGTPAEEIFQHAFTEMLNNAVDHSQGLEVSIRIQVDNHDLAFEIIDDGLGVFVNLKQGLGLADNLEAIAELTKGKRTTDPERHTGEGIFFSSKAVDLFRISANGLAWLNDNLLNDWAISPSQTLTGSRVFCKIAKNTTRNIRDVFLAFTEDHNFVRTKPIVKLFEKGETFISRSEAKRLMIGLDNFEELILDFDKVKAVGQGFVDEVFRVWQSNHPSTQIQAVNMSKEVEFMVRRCNPHG